MSCDGPSCQENTLKKVTSIRDFKIGDKFAYVFSSCSSFLSDYFYAESDPVAIIGVVVKICTTEACIYFHLLKDHGSKKVYWMKSDNQFSNNLVLIKTKQEPNQ